MRSSYPLPTSVSASATFGLSREVVAHHLEAESEEGDLVTCSCPEVMRLTTPVDRHLVGRDRAREKRQLYAVHASEVQQFAEVLAEAGAAERESRPQVARGDIQLRVRAEDLHHLARLSREDGRPGQARS